MPDATNFGHRRSHGKWRGRSKDRKGEGVGEGRDGKGVPAKEAFEAGARERGEDEGVPVAGARACLPVPEGDGEVPHSGPPVEKPLLKQEQAALPRQDPGVVRSARASTSRPERSHAATPL